MKEEIKEKIPYLRTDLFASDAQGKLHLQGNQCKKCGRFFFPKKRICADCLEDGTLEDVFLSDQAKIHQGFVVHVAPVGFNLPYTVAFVDLPEGIRLFSEIKDAEKYLMPGTETLIPGTTVELVIEKICNDPEGNPVTGFKFRPIRGCLKSEG